MAIGKRQSQEENIEIAQEHTEKERGSRDAGGGIVAAILTLLIVTVVMLLSEVAFPAENANNRINVVIGALEDHIATSNSMRGKYADAAKLLRNGDKYGAARAFSEIRDYSDAWERCFEIWNEITEPHVLSCGAKHTVGLQTDGTVVAVGDNDSGQLCLSKGKCSKRARKRRAEAVPEIDMDNVDGMTVEAEGAGMHTFWCSFGARNRKQEARRAQLHTFW